MWRKTLMALDQTTGTHYNSPKQKRRPVTSHSVSLSASSPPPSTKRKRRRRKKVDPYIQRLRAPGGQPYLFLPGITHRSIGDVPGFNQTPYPAYFFGYQDPGYTGPTPLELLRRSMSTYLA